MNEGIGMNTVLNFDEHAIAIAKRQYFVGADGSLSDMFLRVANWVAKPENKEIKTKYEKEFYELMASKKFCPGGRVLAGAGTQHGNVLNCFVQDGSPKERGSNSWVLHLATKLALVTKVGGGNGVNIDPIKPKRHYGLKVGNAYLTIDDSHPDFDKVMSGTYMDLVHGEYTAKGYRFAKVIKKSEIRANIQQIRVGDSVDKIWQAASEMIPILLDGNDVVIDLSDLRAEGAKVNGSGGTSSGPSSFAVEVFDNFAYWASLGAADYAGPVATLRYIFAPTLRVIRQGGTRRGAGMATMSIGNPDIDDFITSKDLDREKAEGDISTFNISVLVDDEFMNEASKKTAKALQVIADHAWQTGEPGLIFVDRINEFNPMRAAYGDIKATNPCGEIPLYAGEPCDLGALNLSAYVKRNNEGLEGFDFENFADDTKTAIRFLDNVLEVNQFALADNREMSMKMRRLGLGIMGLADALIKMGYRYNSELGRKAVAKIINNMRENATLASQELAKERGAFDEFEKSEILTERRNVAVLTVAPTGTTSMLFGVSSGVEPVFAPFVYRKIGDSYVSLIHPLFKELLEQHRAHKDYMKGDSWDWDKVVKAVQEKHGSVQSLDFIPADVKNVLVCAHDISPEDHVKMQATVQVSFDSGGEMIANSISKTINMPNKATVEDVYSAYKDAFALGCKGVTVYRDGSRQFQVLSTSSDDDDNAEAEETVETSPAATMVSRLPGEPLFDRPGRLTGFTDTVKLTTTSGEKRGFYITVNTQDGLPTELFINSGRAGDEANADSEALGRLVSIALQYGVPAAALVKTLRGISGGMYGTYQGRMVASKADIIAVALETSGIEKIEKSKSDCPECGAPLRYEEGCQKCEACGYSKCG